MIRLERDKLREKGFSRGRQVTGCIDVVRRSDLVKEIGQTRDGSATVRPARRTWNRRMVTAEGARLLHLPCNPTGGVCQRHDISESTCTATSSRVACD